MSEDIETLNEYIELYAKLKVGEVQYKDVIDRMRELYDLVLEVYNKRDIYFQALCDIESGEDVRKILERTLT